MLLNSFLRGTDDGESYCPDDLHSLRRLFWFGFERTENLVSSTRRRENRSTSLSKLMPIEYKEADKNLQFGRWGRLALALAPVVCLLDDEIWLKSCTIAGSWESKKSLTRRHFHQFLGVFFIPFEGLLKILSSDAIGIASPMRYFAIGKSKVSVTS